MAQVLTSTTPLLAPLRDGGHFRKPGFIFWLLWTLFTALSWSIILAINVSLSSFDNFRALWVAGLIQGLFQWLALRPYIKYSAWWIVATAIGAFFPGLYILFGGTLPTTLILIYLGVSIAHWLVLSWSIQRASLWILIKSVAFIVMAVVSALPFFGVLYDGSDNPVYWAILGLIAGSTFGAVTGVGLLWLLRYPVAQAEESTGKPRPMFTPIHIVAGLTALVLIILPFFTLWQVFALQSRVYCNVLKIGMPHTEVISQLSQVRTVEESKMGFMRQGTGTVFGEEIPYPQALEAYAAQVVNFAAINIHDELVAVPALGLGYDKDDNLVLISSDNRNYDLQYQHVQCPWTFQATLNSLFK